MSGIKLISTGSALPVQEVTNFDLEKRVDTSDEWIATRTGIRSRHYCSEGETHLGLCMAAARQALERSGLAPSQIGVCLVATLTQDTMTPSAACVLQKELGLAEDTVCFDLNAACAGFVYGLHTAECLLAASERKYGLVIGCEVLSRITDFTDRSTCVLFGDGAAAAVVRLADVPYACVLGGRGEAAGLHANSLLPGQNRTLFMDGRAIFRFAVDIIPKCLNQLFEKSGTSLEQVDHVVCHQANSRIIDHVVKKLGAPEDKFYKNMHRYGNTSAASIPLALDEMLESGAIQPGQTVACVGFGAGLTWGAVLLRF